MRGNTTPQEQTNPTSGSADPAVDPTLEADPEIIDLKKSLRKAQLQRQLEEFSGPAGLENRLLDAETQLEILTEELWDLQGRMDGSLLVGIHGGYECTCGAKGLVSVKVRCTACDKETSYGWYPNT